MNLLILGKGKTGSLVVEVARRRGHAITAVGSAENAEGAATRPEALAPFDVVLDFTSPESVIHNISAVTRARRNMVVGTTGWSQHVARVRELVELSGTGFVYGSNFSIGVNLFFEIARTASAALGFGYQYRIMERHHAHKKDAPSGTAVTLQNVLHQDFPQAERSEIVSVREGETIGTHALLLDSPYDTMMLTHDAKSRLGFAEGAVRAAEWLHGRTGFYEFREIFRDLKEKDRS
jgi:4-hydroxy-tetrahydrodipicolinate reductase